MTAFAFSPHSRIKLQRLARICLFIAVMMLLSGFAAASDYVCGDANGDEAVNIGDAVFLSAYVFQNDSPPEPLAAGDANFDDNVNIGDIVYLVNFIFHDGPIPCLAGKVLAKTGCKTFPQEDEVPPNLDCIQYEYDGQLVLKIKHLNAGFNCCPDTITADIEVEGNVITVSERESTEVHGGCDCLCLFNVEYQVNHVLPGVYTIKFVEPYLPEGDDTLEVTVELTSEVFGEFCVSRTDYPWGTEYNPSGGSSGGSGCKDSKEGKGATESCIEYDYDGESYLSLKHVNSVLNCCPWSPYASITVVNDSIIIGETGSGNCFCVCVFDINMYVYGLHPGRYRVIINEPFMGMYYPDDEKFDFELDLYSEPVSGSICLPRNFNSVVVGGK